MTSTSDSRPAAQRRMVDTASTGRVAFFEDGQGPDLVLIHGAIVNADDMRIALLDSLAPHFRTVAFDRPGHGLSERPASGDASLWRQAEILREAAGRLGLRRPVLVGHSYGGAVALAWAMSAPDEVAGVVALAPICFPEPRLEHALFGPRAVPGTGDLLARLLHGTADPFVLGALWRAMFLPQSMPAAFAAGFSFPLAGGSGQTVREGEDAAALVPDLTRSAMSYAACRVPVRFLCGSADIVVSSNRHSRLASYMVPGAGLQVLPGLGHMLHHFRQEDVVTSALAVAGERNGAPPLSAAPGG